MASGNRASMREGPLAQLFRKTEEDSARCAAGRAGGFRQAAAAPRGGAPPGAARRMALPEGGPSPQITRRGPSPAAVWS